MKVEASGQHLVGQAERSGHVTWTSSMFSYMLSYLGSVVANGTRTSAGFKKVHLNSCARALNEHFNIRLTGDQISNHVRTWKRKYAKINKLRRLSGALWDENNFIIGLDHDHYARHIKDHKADAEYLDKPIEHYGEMVVIFGNSLASGKYAKGSNEPLATEVTEGGEENGDVNGVSGINDVSGVAATNEENGATSSATKPKKAKTTASEEDGLVGTFKTVGERLAVDIEKASKDDNELPEDLFESMHTF